MAEISQQGEDRASLSFALYNLRLISKYRGDLAGAADLMQQAVFLGQEIGFKHYLCAYLYDLSELDWLMGQSQEARKRCHLALELAREMKRQEIMQKAKIFQLALNDEGMASDHQRILEEWPPKGNADLQERNEVIAVALYRKFGRKEYLNIVEGFLRIIQNRGWQGYHDLLKGKLEDGQG